MGLFTADEMDPVEQKQQAVQALLGNEDIDVSRVEDEELDGLLLRLIDNPENSLFEKTEEVVEVMEELEASEEDIAEALKIHLGYKLSEAREIVRQRI